MGLGGIKMFAQSMKTSGTTTLSVIARFGKQVVFAAHFKKSNYD
jgi:hypothetical protein